MGIENFQEFHIRSNQGDQIAFVFSFQFCGAKLSEGLKHLVTDDCQQGKCNVMIRTLFRKFQGSPKHCYDDKDCKDRGKGGRTFLPDPAYDCYSPKDRNKLCTKETQRPHDHGKDHKARERLDQFYHAKKH